MKLLDCTEIQLERLDMGRVTLHPWMPYELVQGTVGVIMIIRDLAVKLGKLTIDEERDVLPLRMLIGQGWEAMCAQMYPELHWQPGVYELDGISGHPDGLSGVEHGLPVLEEFKYTSKSLRVKYGKADQFKDICAEWMWQVQVMAYCTLMSHYLSQPVRHARLHVCWAMGCYTTHMLDEKYLRYLVEYDDDELARNWQMLLTHKESL